MWKTSQIAKWLTSHNFNFIAYDKFGCGESSGDWKQVSLDTLRDDLAAISDFIYTQLKAPVIIMGQSEGSIIAPEAANLTNSIKALVLRVASNQNIRERMKYQYEKLEWEEDAWKAWNSGIQKIETSHEQRKPITGFLMNYPNTYWLSRLNRKLTAAHIQELNIPIFALNGEKDIYTPKDAFEEIHKTLNSHISQKSKAKIYNDVGHSLSKTNEHWGESEADKDIIDWLNLLDL